MQSSEDFCILATIVKTEGSTYQKAGAQMRIFPDGRQEGIISGACAENKILESAKQVARTKQTILLNIDSFSPEDIVFGYGVGCQGRQAILLENLDASQAHFKEPIHEKYVCALIYASRKNEDIGKRLYLSKDGVVFSNTSPQIRPDIEIHARKTLEKEQSSTLNFEDFNCEISFIFHKPKPVLHIFGAGADARVLCELIAWMGWTLDIYDHRPHFSNAKYFPQARLHSSYELETPLSLRCQHMAIVMTHNYMTDLMILERLIREPFVYIGLLGPKKRGQQALEELSKTSTITNYDQIYFPVGLCLGGRNPHELALSIVAELQSVYCGTSGVHLRDV